jgi:hypothetical protein
MSETLRRVQALVLSVTSGSADNGFDELEDSVCHCYRIISGVARMERSDIRGQQVCACRRHIRYG